MWPKTLVGHPNILQAEWHDIVGVSSPMNGEHCFGFVFFRHLSLIIIQKSLHKGEEHVSRGVINQGIDCGKGKLSFRLARFKSL